MIRLWKESNDFGRLWIAATYLKSSGFTDVEVQELETTETDPYFVASGSKPLFDNAHGEL